MSRALGRWIVLGILGAIVAGLVIFTNLSNKRLVSGLQAGDPDALSAFAERQDAYIFLQSESPDVRLRVANGLAGWKDDAAAKLILKLIPDPDPSVRAALIDSLRAAAARNPAPVAAEFSAGGAAESAALIEASSRDIEVGLSILKAVLAQNPGSVNGTLLAKRLGSRSEPVLIPLLNHNDAEVRLDTAQTLAALGLDAEAERRVSAVLLEMYRASDEQAFKDRLLPVLAQLAPKEGAAAFIEVALDHTAPSDLRAVATRALAKMDDPIVAELAQDADTNVAAAARQ